MKRNLSATTETVYVDSEEYDKLKKSVGIGHEEELVNLLSDEFSKEIVRELLIQEELVNLLSDEISKEIVRELLIREDLK